MKVYGHPMSTCTRKVLCTLAEKGQTADFVTIDIMKGEGKLPEHITRQPLGKVPALEDDDFVLFESRAIIRYLDETKPGPKLTPADPKGRALMEQWISFEQSHFAPPVMKIVMNLMFAPMMGKTADQAAVEAGTTEMNASLDAMQKQLEKTPFIAGKQFTLADIGFMPYLEYLAATPAFSHVADRPAVAKWWKTISERASWKTATGKSAG